MLINFILWYSLRFMEKLRGQYRERHLPHTQMPHLAELWCLLQLMTQHLIRR